MTVKLFVLGLTGSGKSTVARFITICAMGKGWLTTRFNDYTILQKMFRDETESKRFKPAKHGGFDIRDLTVYDTALKRLEQQIKKYASSAKPDEIILIEFSRNNYRKAFRQFSHEFLHDAYFLYLDVDTKTCKKRIRERIANPGTDDTITRIMGDIYPEFSKEIIRLITMVRWRALLLGLIGLLLPSSHRNP